MKIQFIVKQNIISLLTVFIQDCKNLFKLFFVVVVFVIWFLIINLFYKEFCMHFCIHIEAQIGENFSLVGSGT